MDHVIMAHACRCTCLLCGSCLMLALCLSAGHLLSSVYSWCLSSWNTFATTTNRGNANSATICRTRPRYTPKIRNNNLSTLIKHIGVTTHKRRIHSKGRRIQAMALIYMPEWVQGTGWKILYALCECLPCIGFPWDNYTDTIYHIY